MEAAAAWDRLVTIVEAQPWCTLITSGPDGYPHPRTVTRLNRVGTLRAGTAAHLDFPTDLGSRKVPEIRADARVSLFFVDPKTRDHATLLGRAELLTDDDLRRKYHREHGFEGRWASPTDPAYLIIRVHLVRAEFLDAPSEVTTTVELTGGVPCP